jgi:type I restriction enzyme M protein
MTTPISQQELESYLWGAATHLRGHVSAGDYKQFIFPLLFFKRLSDVYDEEYSAALAESGGDEAYAAFPEQHRFVIPDGAHWRDVRAVAKNVGKAVQAALRAIEAANPGKLEGIFGDAPWTNRERLPDEMLKNLVEHFSSRCLDRKAVPEDELGNAYEFLIKKFADDSGHTAQEFYTNRTLVHLMVQMLAPKAGETIYDPTCGTGGMLISALAEVKRLGGEWRTLGLYGQEINLTTSAIARMNLVLHGVEDFEIQRGDTLAEPKFVSGDRLRTFDLVLANPPYSIKQWNRDLWAVDPFGRNMLGTPPQGRADYAFFQHILSSLDPKTGRCAILFPHGVLFRKEEAEMRENLIQRDLVECVLGLGPSLFYNSTMEACVVICRTQKPKARKGKVLFIDAVNEIARDRIQTFLRTENQSRILAAYKAFENERGFTAVADKTAIEEQGWSLSMPLYVTRETGARNAASNPDVAITLAEAWSQWRSRGEAFWTKAAYVTSLLDGIAKPESHDEW